MADTVVTTDHFPTPLLSIKLFIPQARQLQDILPRPRLVERLQKGLSSRLTLISAPAGFGKSTLLTEWIPHSDRCVCWLSLDEADNDLARFLTYFIAALQGLRADFGQTLLVALQTPNPPAVEHLMTALVNEIIQSLDAFVLVLDDYHLIELPTIHTALTFLLNHLPPKMHLILTSRADPPLPLARLRARRHLSEIRAADLRFTPAESAVFLNEIMSLNLSTEDIAILETRTEGWIVGLQLVALSIQGRGASRVADFIRAFSGSHRHVLSYLVEEVLNQCPASTLDFLLQTSILDRLSASLCDAVIGRNDSQQMLEQIEAANLFLIPLDDVGQWYRYHHLFAEVLQSRLQQGQSDLTSVLHRRASEWYERVGQLNEAIHHALAAQAWERAAWLLKPIVKQMVERVTLAGQAQTVLKWLEALPVAVIRAHPTLCFYHATALMFTHQLEAAEVWLNDAEQTIQPVMPSDEVNAILGWVALIRADIARVRGDLASGVILAQRALEILPDAEALARAVAQMNVAHAYLVNGDVTSSVERLAQEAVAPLRTIGNRFATMIAITNLARLQALQGRCRQAAATFALAEQITPDGGRVHELLNGVAVYIGLGDLLREWNDLEMAHQQLTVGIELVRGVLSVDADVVTTGYVALAKLRQARGDLPGGLLVLGEFGQLAAERSYFAPLVARGEAVRTQLWLASGNLAAAVQWAETKGLHADDPDLSYLRETEYLTCARVLIAQHRTEESLRLLARLLLAAEAGNRRGRVIEILMLQALALQAQSIRTDKAFAELNRALTLAEPEGYIRLFVDEGKPMEELLSRMNASGEGGRLKEYIHKLLLAFETNESGLNPINSSLHPSSSPGAPRSAVLQPLVEPLSAREQEILQLVAEGLSNNQIATRLIITTGTVKTHINRIFGKLDVQSRTQAIARGRELGLIAS